MNIQEKLRKIRDLSILAFNQLATKRGWLVVAGAFSCCYAIAVLFYVQAIPDLGLTSAFSTEIKEPPRNYQGTTVPREGDVVVGIDHEPIHTWPDLLHAPFLIAEKRGFGEQADPIWVE